MKTIIIFLYAMGLPGMLFAQFDMFRLPYQNPNHIGILLDSAVLPSGNFKAMTYTYDATSEIWRLSSETITERENSRITKTIRTNYPSTNKFITTYDYEGGKLRTISNYSKPSNSNDTVLSGRDTFYYNNDVIVLRHTVITAPPKLATQYLYDTLKRKIETRIEIYDSSFANIAFIGYFEVNAFQENNPHRLTQYAYEIFDTFFVHRKETGYVTFQYDNLNRITSKASFSFIEPLGDYIQRDSIWIKYNSNGNPEEMLLWTNEINVQNRITTYTYNDEQILTEVFEREENGQPRTKTIYTTDLSTGKNEIELNSVAVNIYPNPATSIFEIHTTDDVQIAHITLFTISGRRAMEISKPVKQIEINQLPAGLYFVEIETNKGKVHRRLVVN